HVQVDEVEARRSGGVGHGLREKRRHDLHDDSGRVELGDRVSGEVADLDGDVRSNLDPTLLAALHGNLRIGDGLTEPFVLQQAEELSELREVDLVGGVDVFIELIEDSVRAQAESRLLHSTRSGASSTTSSSLTTATRLLPEEDVPVQPQLTCLRHVQFEEDCIDLDLSRPQRGWTRRLFGPGSSAGPRGRCIEHASLLRRLFDYEVAIRLAVGQPVVIQDELEGIHEMHPCDGNPDRELTGCRVYDLLTRHALKDGIQEIHEDIERRGRQK